MDMVGICKPFSCKGPSLLLYLANLLFSILSFLLGEANASTACIFCEKHSTEALLLVTVVGLKTLFFSVWSLLDCMHQTELSSVFLT